jgi:hypothetical protein
VAAGIQLAEQPVVGVALDPDPQRRGPGRPGQPERLDLLDHQAELVLQGLTDRLPTCPTDVQVSAAPTPVGDREDLAGRKDAKAEQRDRHPNGDPNQDIGGGLHRQVHAGDGDQDDQRGGHPLAGLAPASLRHQAIQDPDQDHHQRRQLLGWQRPGVPVGPELHPERPRPLQKWGQQVLDEEALQNPGRQHDQQLPQAAEHQQGQQQSPQQHRDGQIGVECGQRLHRRQQPGCPQPGQPSDHRSIDHGDVDSQAMQPTGKDQQRQYDQDHGGDQPSHPGGLQMMRQWWGLAGWTPPPRRAPNSRRTGLDPRTSSPSRLVCGHVHGASQPRRRPPAAAVPLQTHRRP